jgi:hypothetical protein
MGDCAVCPVSALWHCAAHSRTANAPCPRRGPAAPSNPSLVNLQGQTMMSGRWERHPRPCSTTPGTVERAGTGPRHACHCALYGSLSTTSSSQSEDATANHYAFTLETAPVQVRDAPRRQDRSKGRQDGRQLPSAAHHTSTSS